jgi:hypothetical protein
MIEPLHFAASAYRPNCWWCGEQLRGDFAAPRITVSKVLWEAAPDSCKVLRPLTTAIFEEDHDDSSLPRAHYFTTFPMNDEIQIDDDLLQERLARVEPLVQKDNGIWRIRPVDLRRTAFTWSPELISEAKVIREIAVTPTYHSCGYYGFFKPDVAEVLAQLPDDPEINGFVIDIGTVKVCSCGTGQIARTRWLHIEVSEPSIWIEQPYLETQQEV